MSNHCDAEREFAGPPLAPLGSVLVRGKDTAVRLHCDAVAALEAANYSDGQTVLLLSIAGAESAVKAALAALRSPDEGGCEFVFDIDAIGLPRARRCEDGYRVYRTHIGGGLWHALAVAKVEGLLPVVSEESLWQELRSERYTTPVLRSWVPWLLSQLRKHGGLAEIRQHGCNVGLLRWATCGVDSLVVEGIKSGKLRIGE